MPDHPHYRRARLVFGVACLSAIAVFAYRKRQDCTLYRRWTVWKAYSDTLESWRTIASTLRLLTQDLSDYVHARSTDECPESIKRLFKLGSSPECIDAMSRVVDGLAARTAGQPSMMDSLIEAALSDRGQNLVGIVVGMSTTKAVQAIAQAVAQRRVSTAQPATEHHAVLAWLSSPAAQSLVCRSIATFVSTGVATYCDKTAGDDVYGEMMHALAKPRHLEAVRSLASTVCHTSITAAVQSIRSPAGIRNGTNGADKQQAHPDANWGHRGQGEAGLVQRIERPAPHAWTNEIIHACSVPDVRQTVAQAARAGCAGAVEASISNIGQQLASSRHTHLIATVLLSWLLLLPLWLLHVSATPPGHSYL